MTHTDTARPTLASLREGDSRTIVDIEGDDAVAVRLMEMGLTEGEQIQLVGFAPFGDPIEFLVRGYRISLRTKEAQRVIVSPD